MAAEEGRSHQVVELLSEFSVDTLPAAWIRNVIDSDFTEVEDLPPEFQDYHFSTNLGGLFTAVNGILRQWVDNLPTISVEDADKILSISRLNAGDDVAMYTRFWIDLSEDLKGLMALMFYYCSRGQRYDAREPERGLGIQASSLYFLLLCIPGSNAFRVFHPVMYIKGLDILRLTLKLRVGSASPREGDPWMGRQRKSQDEQADDADDEGEVAVLSPSEANELIRSLNVLLKDFLRLTQKFSLKHSPELLDETVSILVDVPRCETNSAHGIFVGRHGSATVTAALAYNAYVALQSICSAIHGKVKKIVIIIMKYILHNILMKSRGSSDLSPRSLGVIRDHSQIFVKHLLTRVKQDAYEGVYILIQQLCLHVPDRAEFRQKTAQSVVEILRYLPIQLYTRLVRWFFKFSRSEKAGHRLFMLEVISKMLGEEERHVEGDGERENPSGRPRLRSIAETEDEEDGGISFLSVTVNHPVEVPQDRNVLSHKFLLSIIFSRCCDTAATVRSKALALLADCTFSTNPTIMLAMKQIFFRGRPTIFTTPHIPNINLESPLDTEGDEDLDLPSAATMVSMLRRRALDNKVTVRKSALQVMENLMRLDNEMLSDKNLVVRYSTYENN